MKKKMCAVPQGYVSAWKNGRRHEAAECPASAMSRARWIVVDGIYIHRRKELALIARADTGEIFWGFAPYESSWHWERFFHRLPTPGIVACDGQKGLIKAIGHKHLHLPPNQYPHFFLCLKRSIYPSR